MSIDLCQQVPIGGGYSNKTATVLVSATDGNSIIEGGHFVVGGPSGSITKLVSGTPNVASTNVAGKLCLLPGNDIALLNNLNADVDVEILISF